MKSGLDHAILLERIASYLSRLHGQFDRKEFPNFWRTQEDLTRPTDGLVW